jgi:hypothetical protein
MKIDSPSAIGISAGFGIPTGGTTNQILRKIDGTNYNTEWVDDNPKTVGVNWSNSYGNSYFSPTLAGGNLVGNAVWLNNNQGVRLTSANIGQNGTIYWVLNDFDFTKDFRASFMTYYNGTVNTGVNGDGHYFNFGGSAASTSSYAVADGSLSVAYDPYSGAYDVKTWVNGTSVGNRPLFEGGIITTSWVNWIIEVQRNITNNKKEVTIYCNNTVQLVVDVSTWSPTGKIFTVGAWTGGAFCEHFVYSAKIEYI